MAAEAIGTSPYELMNTAGAKSPPGANGLLYLPYLLGERSPRWNPRARGAFIGLTVRHTHADMVRAVLEGVTMNLRVILEAFRAQGAQIEAMRVIGGGARGRFWNQIIADIYGVPSAVAILEEATDGRGAGGWDRRRPVPRLRADQSMNTVAEVIEPTRRRRPSTSASPDLRGGLPRPVPVYDLIARADL